MSAAVLPDDAFNRDLVRHVHPPGWVNPTPPDRYDLVVIGGGPAGLVAAFGAVGLGARVALIERDLLGGDCLNWGCVPSKALLRPAHVASALRHAADLGLAGEPRADFEAVMARMRRIRAGIAPHDGAERLRAEGVDVFLGAARFVGADAVAIGDQTLRFAKCCIATGARAAVPPIPGLADAGALTNEGLFALTAPPEHLVILGAGVIGCEMAQAFAGLGVQVSLLDQADRVLPREDVDASAVVQRALQRDGVALHLGVGVTSVARAGERREVTLADGRVVAGDALLVALGRTPNLDLDLERAGVRATRRGVEVDAHLRTSNPRIFAAGDVIGQAQFTHAADHQARLVLRNALFFGRARVADLVIPRVTYTAPEVAAVGVSAAEAAADPTLTAYEVALSETDRGRTDGDGEGFCRVYADARGRIRGATVVGEGAGELLAPVTLAMTHGLTLGQIASTIHPYPTRSEALFKVASAYNKTRFRPWMKGIVAWLLRWTRR